MKIYINGITLTNGKRTQEEPATHFYLTAIEEGGNIVFSKQVDFRGLKGSAASAEFEALYHLISPANEFKKYDIICTNYKLLPGWVQDSKAPDMAGISEFEFEIINYYKKGKVIFEPKNNPAKLHNEKKFGKVVGIPATKGNRREEKVQKELELLPFLPM